jgi:hypothetical protein
LTVAAVAISVLTVAWAVASQPGSAADDFRPWTAAGSTGTVDDADQQKVVLDGSMALLKPNLSLPAMGVLRFNVTPADQISSTGGRPALQVGFVDNGGGAQVTARLMSQSHLGGPPTALVTVNSASFPSSPNLQLQEAANCTEGAFNFSANSYYVDVTLRRTTSGGTPKLGNLKVLSLICTA